MTCVGSAESQERLAEERASSLHALSGGKDEAAATRMMKVTYSSDDQSGQRAFSRRASRTVAVDEGLRAYDEPDVPSPSRYSKKDRIGIERVYLGRFLHLNRFLRDLGLLGMSVPGSLLGARSRKSSVQIHVYEMPSYVEIVTGRAPAEHSTDDQV